LVSKNERFDEKRKDQEKEKNHTKTDTSDLRKNANQRIIIKEFGKKHSDY